MAALEFIQTMVTYDEQFVQEKINNWGNIITEENELNIKKIKFAKEIQKSDMA